MWSNVLDTADVYGEGTSEKLIAKALRNHVGPRPFLATKAGKRLTEQNVSGFTPSNLRNWVERSLDNLEVESLDLLQLHCPPTELYYHPEFFEVLDDLVEERLIRNYGVSVEKIEEPLKAVEYLNVTSVQIIYNMLRQRPEIVLCSCEGEKRGCYCASSAGKSVSVRQVRPTDAVRQGGPSEFQSISRGIRRWGDILRRSI